MLPSFRISGVAVGAGVMVGCALGTRVAVPTAAGGIVTRPGISLSEVWKGSALLSASGSGVVMEKPMVAVAVGGTVVY